MMIISTYILNYKSTKISKSLLSDPAKLEWRSPSDLKIKFNTNLRSGVVSLHICFRILVIIIIIISTRPLQELIRKPRKFHCLPMRQSVTSH